jgi:hypothetical protein
MVSTHLPLLLSAEGCGREDFEDDTRALGPREEIVRVVAPQEPARTSRDVIILIVKTSNCAVVSFQVYPLETL